MIDALLKYQQTDANLKKIETELSGSEERKKAVSAKKYIEGVEESVNKLDSHAADLIAAFDRVKKEIESLNAQKAEFEGALKSVADETEANYLLKKMDELIGRIKALSSEAVRINGEIQSLIKEYASVKSATKAAQAQYSEYGKKYNELKASKKADMEKIEKELEKLAKDVPPELLEKYNKKRKEKRFPVLVEVKGNICSSCRMEIPMSAMSKLKNGEIIECDQCRCLLYKNKD